MADEGDGRDEGGEGIMQSEEEEEDKENILNEDLNKT